MTEAKTKVRSLYDELVAENAMTEEAVRYARKAWRGSSPGTVIANVIVVGLLALLYVWLMIAIIKWELQITMGIEFVELLVVTLIAPSSIYAAISGEREKATWDALVLTRLTPAQIVAGKLVWRIVLLAAVMGLMLLMVLVSQTQGHMGDRPSAMAVFMSQLLILAWGLLLSAFGLWVSARTKRSVTSIGVILASVLGALIMLPALLSAFGANLDPDEVRNGLDVLGAMAAAVNPFLIIGYLSDGQAGRYQLLADPNWAMAVVLTYLLVTGLFLWRTHAVVKRLSGE